MNRIHLNTAIGAFAVALLAAPAALAQSFAYSDQDLLIGFRQSGAPDTLLVNVGNINTLILASQTANHAVVIGDAALLKSTFANLGGLKFSASAANKFGATPAINTLWVSRASSDTVTEATPWNRQGAGTLGTTANRISSLGNGGVTVGSITPSDVLANGIVMIPSGNNNTVGRWVGSNPGGGGSLGNFNNTFQGNAEQTTPNTFTTGMVREDLFQIIPGTGDSEWVASLYLDSQGKLQFRAIPEPSTYATIAGFALAGFALWRRRSVTPSSAIKA